MTVELENHFFDIYLLEPPYELWPLIYVLNVFIIGNQDKVDITDTDSFFEGHNPPFYFFSPFSCQSLHFFKYFQPIY